MKKILMILLVISTTSCANKAKNIPSKLNSLETVKSNLLDIYAGPFNEYGSAIKVYSVFGKNVGCKINIFENNTNGNIFFQVKYSSNEKTTEWQSYNEGDFIKAQVVYCRATSTSTGGNVKIKIN